MVCNPYSGGYASLPIAKSTVLPILRLAGHEVMSIDTQYRPPPLPPLPLHLPMCMQPQPSAERFPAGGRVGTHSAAVGVLRGSGRRYKGHAEQYTRQMNLGEFDGIVCVGGNGCGSYRHCACLLPPQGPPV